MGVSRYSDKFRADAVRLMRAKDQPIGKLAKRLGVTTKTLREWVRQADVDEGSGPADALTTIEKQELAALRRENRELKRERDFLTEAAAYFAKVNK